MTTPDALRESDGLIDDAIKLAKEAFEGYRTSKAAEKPDWVRSAKYQPGELVGVRISEDKWDVGEILCVCRKYVSETVAIKSVQVIIIQLKYPYDYGVKIPRNGNGTAYVYEDEICKIADLSKRE